MWPAWRVQQSGRSGVTCLPPSPPHVPCSPPARRPRGCRSPLGNALRPSSAALGLAQGHCCVAYASACQAVARLNSVLGGTMGWHLRRAEAEGKGQGGLQGGVGALQRALVCLLPSCGASAGARRAAAGPPPRSPTPGQKIGSQSPDHDFEHLRQQDAHHKGLRRGQGRGEAAGEHRCEPTADGGGGSGAAALCEQTSCMARSWRPVNARLPCAARTRLHAIQEEVDGGADGVGDRRVLAPRRQQLADQHLRVGDVGRAGQLSQSHSRRRHCAVVSEC